MSDSSNRATRPGGRSALVLASVKTAVEELIEERGRERITIPMVAERAGVNPTSVYRRWGDLQTMINDIATYRLNPERPLPDSGELRADLEAWAREIVTHYSTPVNAALLRGGAAAAGERESDCLRNRRVEATQFVEREQERARGGERAGARSDGSEARAEATARATGITADAVIDHVVAPIIYRIIFSPWAIDEDYASMLVDELFDRHPAPDASAAASLAR